MRQGYGYRNRRHLRLRMLLEVVSWILHSFTLKDTAGEFVSPTI